VIANGKSTTLTGAPQVMSIEKLYCSEEFHRLIFELISVPDSHGRNQPAWLWGQGRRMKPRRSFFRMNLCRCQAFCLENMTRMVGRLTSGPCEED